LCFDCVVVVLDVRVEYTLAVMTFHNIKEFFVCISLV